MDDKELPERIQLNVHMKQNELEIESKTAEQLKTQSFPQFDCISDKNKHAQFAMNTDENVNKTNSSILDEEHIHGQFHDTESDEDPDEELEIIVQDSEDKEIQLLVDQRDDDYRFLPSLCDSYAFCVVAN